MDALRTRGKRQLALSHSKNGRRFENFLVLKQRLSFHDDRTCRSMFDSHNLVIASPTRPSSRWCLSKCFDPLRSLKCPCWVDGGMLGDQNIWGISSFSMMGIFAEVWNTTSIALIEFAPIVHEEMIHPLEEKQRKKGRSLGSQSWEGFTPPPIPSTAASWPRTHGAGQRTRMR